MIGKEGESDIDWAYSLEANPVPSQRTPTDRGKAERYLQIMSQVFLECQRVLRQDGGRLVFTFHHWDQLAWASLTKALKRARFGLVEFHIVHSENPISVHIANMRALTDDAILILAPSQTESTGSWIKPTEVNHDSSSHFSRDCATLLGWMLSSELQENQIGQIWEQMLRDR
jgi:adenine-specific DNA methylase